MVVLALVATACSGGGGSSSGTTAKPGSTDTATDQQLDVAAIVAASTGLTEEMLSARDIVGDDLTKAMGTREALGADATKILAAIDVSRSAALAKLPTAEVIAASIGRSRPMDTSVNAHLFSLIQILLPPNLDSLTSNTIKPGDTNTDSRTENNQSTTNGVSSTTTVSETTRGSVAGARVEISLQRIERDVVTDPATGANILDLTDDRTIVADMTACPDLAGSADGSVRTIVTINTTTGGARLVGHIDSASKFHGPVSDDAVLQTVTQDFQRTADWTSTAANGRNGSLDVAFTGITTAPSGSGDLNIQSMNASKIGGHQSTTGDATQAQGTDSIGGAAIDIVTISPAYKMAQYLWQNGRCVIVQAPDYNVETPADIGFQKGSRHTEDVDKGSTTSFAVKLRHRFESDVNAELTAELVSGEKSLEPGSVPGGTGRLTYTAPDENDKDAIAKLKSKSKRGIGTLLLKFHTATKKLQVDISGSQTFDGIIPLKVKVATVLLTKQPDGTFAGSAAANVSGSFGPCDPIMTETGTIDLIATQAPPEGFKTQGDWTIVTAPKPTDGAVTFHCPDIPDLGAYGFPAGGISYSFVHDLGPMTVPGEGGTLTLQKAAATWGPINATVVAKLITE